MQKFAYDDLGNAWAELNAAGSLTTRRHYLDAVDALFARTIGTGPVDWYLPDHLGSVRDIVNYAGTTLYTASYDAYGKITSQSGSGGDRYKWTGREWDAEVSLQYNRARYYDSWTGRWISQDPIGFDAGDSNLYRYVRNQPTMSTDPSGLQQFDRSTMRLQTIKAGADLYIQGHAKVVASLPMGSIAATKYSPYRLVAGTALDPVPYFINAASGFLMKTELDENLRILRAKGLHQEANEKLGVYFQGVGIQFADEVGLMKLLEDQGTAEKLAADAIRKHGFSAGKHAEAFMVGKQHYYTLDLEAQIALELLTAGAGKMLTVVKGTGKAGQATLKMIGKLDDLADLATLRRVAEVDEILMMSTRTGKVAASGIPTGSMRSWLRGTRVDADLDVLLYTGRQQAQAQALVEEAARAAGLRLADYVDDVVVVSRNLAGADVSPFFHVINGRRTIGLTPSVLSRPHAGRLIDALHELNHARHSQLLGHARYNALYNSSERARAQIEIMVQDRAIRQAQDYLGHISTRILNNERAYIEDWSRVFFEELFRWGTQAP